MWIITHSSMSNLLKTILMHLRKILNCLRFFNFQINSTEVDQDDVEIYSGLKMLSDLYMHTYFPWFLAI